VNTPSTTRTLLSSLVSAVLPGRRRIRVEAEPVQPRIDPYRQHRMRLPESLQARDRLVASMLRLAGLDWGMEATGPARTLFEEALADYMAVAAPHVTVSPYGYGHSPCDAGYLAIQKAALYLVQAGWGNGRETADASMDLDHAEDLLEEVLSDYIEATSTL
jgi:hypothetical protein